MRFQSDPPLERRHQLAMALMVICGIAAALMICAVIEDHLHSEAQAWAARERPVNHGRR